MKTTSTIYLRPKVNLVGVSSSRGSTWGHEVILPYSSIYNASTDSNDTIHVGVPNDVLAKIASERGVSVATLIADDTLTLTNDEKLYRDAMSCNFNKISNLYIVGNSSSGSGISIGDPNDDHPSSGTQDHQYLQSKGYNTQIEKCLIVSHGVDGIHCCGAANLKIENNDIVMNGRYGLSTWVDANGYFISGNHIESNKNIGAYFVSLWGSSVIGNTIEGNSVDSGDVELYLKQGQGSTIAGNYFEGDNGAIQLHTDNHNLIISGNRFQCSGAVHNIDIADDGSTGNTDITISNNYATTGYILNARTNQPLNSNYLLVNNYSADESDIYHHLDYLSNVTRIDTGISTYVPINWKTAEGHTDSGFASLDGSWTALDNDASFDTLVTCPCLFYVGEKNSTSNYYSLQLFLPGGTTVDAVTTSGISNTKDNADTLNISETPQLRRFISRTNQVGLGIFYGQQ